MSKKLEQSVTDILKEIGEDPGREGLLKTPKRVAKAYEYLTQGYHGDLEKIVNDALFHEDVEEMIVARDIEFYSLCEHHMLPFYGKCHIAYLPKGKVIGLSKMPRIVDMFSRRLQLQERLTTQIAKTLQEILTPYGVGVIMEGTHLCMRMRGVEKQNSVVTSSAMLGTFRSERATRMEFLNLIQDGRSV